MDFSCYFAETLPLTGRGGRHADKEPEGFQVRGVVRHYRCRVRYRRDQLCAGNIGAAGPWFLPSWTWRACRRAGCPGAVESIVSETADGEPIGAIAWRPLIAIVAALIVFGFCLPRLGLLLTLPLLVVVASLAGDEFRWREVFVNAVVPTLGCWLLFVVLLKLTIPVWPTLI